jgi:putative sigma-54 modulation protein
VQIKVTTRHGQLSEEHQNMIREKVSRLVHHFPRLMMIEAVVDVKDEEKLVELQVSAEHKHDFVATERHKDLFTAVDAVLDKVDHQVRKYKEKIQDHRRTPPMSGDNNHVK